MIKFSNINVYGFEFSILEHNFHCIMLINIFFDGCNMRLLSFDFTQPQFMYGFVSRL